MRKIFLFWILVTIAGNMGKVYSQNPFSQFKLEHWDTKNGMPNDQILTLIQGKDGFLWLTGYSGLTRFDGVNFTSFNSRNVPLMKNDNVERLEESEDSTIWIPTPTSGLLGYKNGVFTPYLKGYYSLLIRGKTLRQELLLSTVRASNRFLLFNPRTKKHIEINDSIRIQLIKDGKLLLNNTRDQSGNQWGTLNNNIVRIKAGKINVLTEKEGIQPGAVYYQSLYVDKKNRVWLASSKNLSFWNGKAMIPFPGMEDKPFISANTTSGLIMEDRDGGVWAANLSGLAYLPPNGERFIFAPEKHPLHSQNITNFLEDKEGNIWLASETGLYKLSKSKFVNYSQQDGFLNNRISGVCVIDTNRYIVSSAGKLYLADHGIVRPYPFKNQSLANKPLEVFHLLKDSKGNTWGCGLNNIIRIQGKEEKLIPTNGNVRFAFEDKDKKIWFGIAFRGIAFVNEKDVLEYLPFPAIDFKSLFISSIRKLINGHWLITTFNNGIVLIDNMGKPTYIKDTTGLPTIGVFSSWEDPDGTIWLTTQSGISRYKGGVLSAIGFKDGLPENSLFGFLPDHKGFIWFPSNRGLIRAAKQELDDYLDKKINKINWKLYDDGDGMLNRQCVGARQGAVSPDGKILVPTLGGLVEIDPGKLITNTVPPSVVIHRVLRDSSTINLSQTNTFEPGNHRYIFEYSGLSLTAPEKVKFKFRLTGYDKEWISATGDRKAFYTNIPSGKYTFQVIASNNDDVWNETGARFDFIVSPFFYETAWFRLMAGLLLLGLIWLIVRWRTRAARRQNEMLEAQVVSRTKDLNLANEELNQSNNNLAAQRDNLEKTLGELKTTQAQLIQSEKMASLGELTAGIAHEIQNPLNFINNFSEVNKELLAEMKDELDKGNSNDAKAIANDVIANEEKINHHGKRADAIVKGMLQHSSSGSGKKEPTDINALADEYLRLSYHGLRAKDKSFNATLKTDYDESIGNINIVPQDIGRVLLNLINNAFYAVSEKQQAESKKQKAEGNHYDPQVYVTTKKINGKVEIKIADNGNGIPQKILDKIFQPFFTTKPTGQGTGLGLSLSYDIVKAHGGELFVKSHGKVITEDGTGATFIVQLPPN